MIENLFAYFVSIIVIIAILTSLHFYLRRREIPKARRDITELKRSIENYHKKYRKYPLLDDHSDEQSGRIMNVLCGTKWMARHPYSEEVAQLNPELINFAEYFLGRKTINDVLVDPWQQPYHIAIDTNGDGVTEIELIYAGEETKKRIESPFAIWSDGPNRKNELGSGDDICSWKY